MELKDELNKLSETLKQQRDEINLQLHLASAELKDEWEKSEKEWGQFKEKLSEVVDEGKETTTDLIEKTRIIGEELKNAYNNIHRRLTS
jgi:hypothetical protein